MDENFYARCRVIVVGFLTADVSVRPMMVKHSLDDFLLFARYTAPEDVGYRTMLVEVVKGLQDHYARGVTNAALLYIVEHPNGLDPVDSWHREAGDDVYDHGHLEDVELMARARGYPVHELKDLFVELGDPRKPGYPRDIPAIRAGIPPTSASESARARDPSAAGSQTRAVADGTIHNFCSVVIGGLLPGRQPSPTISEQEREYTEDGGGGLSARHAPYARTPGCPDCVRAGTRCVRTAKCCARCEGVDIRHTLPSSQARLVQNIKNSAQVALGSTNSVTATLSRIDGMVPALRLARTRVQALTDAVPRPDKGP